MSQKYPMGYLFCQQQGLIMPGHVRPSLKARATLQDTTGKRGLGEKISTFLWREGHKYAGVQAMRRCGARGTRTLTHKAKRHFCANMGISYILGKKGTSTQACMGRATFIH